MKAVAFDIDDLLVSTEARIEAYQSDLIISEDVDLVKTRYEKGGYCHLDTPIPYAKAAIRYFMKEDYQIFFITGRRQSALSISIKVMNDLGFPLSKQNAYFKVNLDADTIAHKREAFRDIEQRGYELEYFFDDKITNLKVAKVMGIPHLYATVKEFVNEIAGGLIDEKPPR